MSMMINDKTSNEVKETFRVAFADAIRDQSTDEMIKAVETYSNDLCTALMAEHDSMTAEQLNNTEVLASRGVRVLTADETRYYEALASAMRNPANKVQSALTDLDKVMPETIIDQVMEDVTSQFELLNAIDFVNCSYMTTWLYNKQGVQQAAWGELGSAVTKELAGAFGKLSATQCKLTAYMAISMDYLDLGPAWLDRYVRAILTEAAGTTMEAAIVDGAGMITYGSGDTAVSAHCPVGMSRNLASGTADSDGNITYPQKTAEAVTSLSPSVYGGLIAKLCKTETGRYRPVTDLILVVHPEDYYKKVMPATTVILPTGGYAHDVLPVQTKIIKSTGVAQGKAILGIGKQYLGMLGAAKVNANNKAGVITYSDDCQFLADNRVYKMRLLGNGRPKDNNSFLLLNIANLAELKYKVDTGA